MTTTNANTTACVLRCLLLLLLLVLVLLPCLLLPPLHLLQLPLLFPSQSPLRLVLLLLLHLRFQYSCYEHDQGFTIWTTVVSTTTTFLLLCIDLSSYVSIYPSIYLPACLSIYLSSYLYFLFGGMKYRVMTSRRIPFGNGSQ